MINYFHIFRFFRKSLKQGCNRIVFDFNEDGTYSAKATFRESEEMILFNKSQRCQKCKNTIQLYKDLDLIHKEEKK